MRRCLSAWLVLFLAAATSSAGDAKTVFKRDHPIIPPFERFHANGAGLAQGGQLLLGELNCTSCHKTDNSELAKKSAPVLDTVGQRVKRGYLRKFLADPHKTKP